MGLSKLMVGLFGALLAVALTSERPAGGQVQSGAATGYAELEINNGQNGLATQLFTYNFDLKLTTGINTVDTSELLAGMDAEIDLHSSLAYRFLASPTPSDVKATLSGAKLKLTWTKTTRNYDELKIPIRLTLLEEKRPATPEVIAFKARVSLRLTTGRVIVLNPQKDGAMLYFTPCRITADKSGRVQPGARIRYTFSSGYPLGRIAGSSAICMIPGGTRLVPNSITGNAGGTINLSQGGRIIVEWPTGGPRSFAIGYTVEVANPPADYVENITNAQSSHAARVGYPTSDGKDYGASKDRWHRQEAPTHTLGLYNLSLKMDAVTKTPNEVRTEENIAYTLTARATSPTRTLKVVNTIPPDTELVPGSVSPAATVSGRTITWALSDRQQAVLKFRVKVLSQETDVTHIRNTAEALAVATDGLRATRNTVLGIKYVAEELLVKIEPRTAVPGEVKSGDQVPYVVTARAAEKMTSLTLTNTLPPNVELYPASVSPAGRIEDGKITWEFSETQEARVQFKVKVLKQGPRTLFVTDRAVGKATLESGKTPTATATNTLRYIRDGLEIDIQAKTAAASLFPGDRIDYTLFAIAPRKATKLVLRAAVPPGTQLIPGTVSPAAGTGPRFTWLFNDVSQTPNIKFAVKVLPKADRPAGLKEITLTSTGAATFLGGETTEAAAEKKVPLALPGVRGVVSDVVMDFPRKTVVEVDNPLAGVDARLLNSEQVLVDRVTTDAEGKYLLEAPKAGVYTVEFRKKANRYERVANVVQQGAWEVLQKRRVTVRRPGDPLGTPDGQVELDLNLPVSLVNGLAKTLKELNTLDLPIQGGIELPWDENWLREMLHLRYQTLDAEELLKDVVTDAEDFKGVYRSGTDRDRWNALIRLNAAMILMKRRYNEVAVLADDIGKTLALAVCIELLKNLGDPKKNKWTTFWQDRGGAAEHAYRNKRIRNLAYVIGPALDYVLSLTSLKPQQKGFIKEVVYKGYRFGTSKRAGKLRDDVTFEIVFLLLRHAIVWSMLEYHVNGLPGDSPGFQSVLDNVSALARRKIYSSDTNPTLVKLEAADALLGVEYGQIHGSAADALRYLSYIRGVNGMWAEQAKYELKTENKIGAKKLFARLDALKAPLARLTLAIYGTAVSLPAGLIYQYNGQIESLATGAFSGEVIVVSLKPAWDILPEGFGAGASGEGAPESGAEAGTAPVRAGATPPPPAVVTQYQAVLDQMKAAVQAPKETYEARAAAFLAAGRALFDDYLEPLGARAEMALTLQGRPATGRIMFDFLEARRLAAEHHLNLMEAIDVWGYDPDPLYLTKFRALFDASRAASARVGELAPGAARVLGQIQLPPAFYVFGGDPASDVLLGSEFTLVYTVQNLGSAPTAAGTARLDLSDGLTAVGSLTRAIPSLAPGQSLRIGFRVQAPLGQESVTASYSLHVSAPNAAPREVTESLVLYAE